MRALRRAGFNPPWPTEVGPTTSHSCQLWALFHVKSSVSLLLRLVVRQHCLRLRA